MAIRSDVIGTKVTEPFPLQATVASLLTTAPASGEKKWGQMEPYRSPEIFEFSTKSSCCNKIGYFVVPILISDFKVAKLRLWLQLIFCFFFLWVSSHRTKFRILGSLEKSLRKVRNESAGGGGILASHPAAPGLIPGIPKVFFRDIAFSMLPH